MSIFSVSFLALAAAASSVMRANQTSYASTIATNLAQDKLEELMATTSANIVTGGPVTDTNAGMTFTRNWTVSPNSPVAGVTQIDVKVDWTDYTDHSLTVTSAVYQ
jgi:Tfp pilus assembly protein PilV